MKAFNAKLSVSKNFKSLLVFDISEHLNLSTKTINSYRYRMFEKLDVGNDVEDDVALDEFSDEIEQWMLDELYKIGLDTAKSVLNLNEGELVRRTELEEENVADILAILKAEFAEDEE